MNPIISPSDMTVRPVLSPEDFSKLSQFIKKYNGQCIDENQDQLILNRLLPLMAQHGFRTLTQMIDRLKYNQFDVLQKDVAESLAIHETSFFRDKKPFDHIQNTYLPWLIEEINLNTIRILCAGCSSGQEVYSMAIVAHEVKKKYKSISISIDATDFSQKVLDQAKIGEYSQFDIQRGLSAWQIVDYFEQEETKWRVKDSLRQNISFQKLNLLESFDHLRPYDLILCRNVLIYFDPQQKQRVFNKLNGLMRSHTALFLGVSETIVGMKANLYYDANLVAYFKKG
jgi:chemotaxis protein methyltransferase CheR